MTPFCQCVIPSPSADWITVRACEPDGYIPAPEPGGQRVDMQICETCGRAILGTQSTHVESEDTDLYTAALNAVAAITDARKVVEASDDDDAYDAAQMALAAAEAAAVAAANALYGSDCPRRWILIEEGQQYGDCMAASAEEALDEAIANVDRDNYCDTGNLYINVRVYCPLTDEEDSATVTLYEPEPACIDGHEHDWRRPLSVVGGCAENPGVGGHGGGVIIREVCAHCGRYRITDTWALRPDTGEQGLTDVTYEDADEASTAWLEPICYGDD